MTTIDKLLLLVFYDLVFLGAPTLANNTSRQNYSNTSNETIIQAKELYFENFLDLGEIQLRNINYSGLSIQQRAVRNLAAMTNTRRECYTVMPANININAVSLL